MATLPKVIRKKLGEFPCGAGSVVAVYELEGHGDLWVGWLVDVPEGELRHAGDGVRLSGEAWDSVCGIIAGRERAAVADLDADGEDRPCEDAPVDPDATDEEH